jgi:LuxR family maltose regulon positive regulatory protein
MAFAAGDTGDVIALTTRALATLPRQWYLARSEAWLHLALAYQVSGQLDRCYAVLESAQGEDVAEDKTLRLRNLAGGMFTHWMAADLDALRRVASHAVTLSETTELVETRGWAHYSLAMVYYQRNDLTAAERHANAVHELRYAGHRIAVVHCAIIQAAIYQARGLSDRAQQALDETENYLRETHSEALVPVVQAFAAELAAIQGNLERAGRWAVTVGPHVPLGIMAFFYAPQLTLPKVLLAIDTPASRRQAAEVLERLVAFVTATHNTRFTIDVLALQALLHDSEGDERSALAALKQAVALAQPGGFIRAFVDLGPRMARLVGKLAQSNAGSSYVRQVLEACVSSSWPDHPKPRPGSLPRWPSIGRSALAEPLTEREQEVLELLAQRLSAKEIAQHLVISDRTVKRHCANIYLKLGVGTRKEAVATAIAEGILAVR